MALIINDNERIVKGRSSAQARQLIDKAVSLGIDPALIRTTTGAYIVPAELVEEAPAEAGEPEVFDPSTKTVPEVLEHLATADDDERDRVLAAEAEGKARKGIIEGEE